MFILLFRTWKEEFANVVFCTVFTSKRSHDHHLTVLQWYQQIGTTWKIKLYLATSYEQNYIQYRQKLLCCCNPVVWEQVPGHPSFPLQPVVKPAWSDITAGHSYTCVITRTHVELFCTLRTAVLPFHEK